MSVRIKAYAGVEEFVHPLIVDKVVSSCFNENISSKNMDELERMFRCAGKLAGDRILDKIKRMTNKKNWLPFKRKHNRDDKLLAIAALKYIPGRDSQVLLRRLSDDHDGYIGKKALYALKLHEKGEDTDNVEELVSAGEEAE
jgi:hypothetical protein